MDEGPAAALQKLYGALGVGTVTVGVARYAHTRGAQDPDHTPDTVHGPQLALWRERNSVLDLVRRAALGAEMDDQSRAVYFCTRYDRDEPLLQL